MESQVKSLISHSEQENLSEKYLGGAAAISRQMREFGAKVEMISMIGEKAEHLSVIKKNTPKDIASYFIKKKNSPTILKKKIC